MSRLEKDIEANNRNNERIFDIIENKGNEVLLTDHIAMVDGISKGNGYGPSGVGIVIYDAKSGRVIYEMCKHLGKVGILSIVAEYYATLYGLEASVKINPSASVEIMISSSLVVNQMNGIYPIKSKNIRYIASKVRDQVNKMRYVKFTWIERSRIKIANDVAIRALNHR